MFKGQRNEVHGMSGTEIGDDSRAGRPLGSGEARAASVTIVGGGASAVLLVGALREQSEFSDRLAISVIEPAASVGPGLAYGRADPHHLLNSPAGRMSVSDDDPDDFVRWCAEHGEPVSATDFAPRRLYGRYLESVFHRLSADGEGVVHVRDRARAVTRDGLRWRVGLESGRSVCSDAVVLAVGNPPPNPLAALATRVVDDPWSENALSVVSEDDRVLLVGTGLTMVDIATTLARRFPALRLAATSRSLLLPTAHPDDPVPYRSPLQVPAGPLRLGSLLSAFGRELRSARAEGIPWQAVVDGMRPQLGSLWSRLSLEDRRRFVSRLSRNWDVHRHRMAPPVGAELALLRRTGRLLLIADPDRSTFDVVINCTGPRSVAEAGWDPVVDSLLSSGWARSDVLGLGVDVGPAFELRSSSGAPSPGLFAIGTAVRGALWETTAVPEIRSAAVTVAETIAAAARLEREPAWTS
jgi:uncharacterized NAD(P)/FAD-binding protein YdhS